MTSSVPLTWLPCPSHIPRCTPETRLLENEEGCSRDISLWRLWLLCTSSMMCSNAHASFVRFSLNRHSCIAPKKSSSDAFKYATCTRISLGYLSSRLNMSQSVPPFHQNAYPSYSSAWIAKKHMTPGCGILTAIDSFRCSILARSGGVQLWFDRLAENFHHD
jgi:hypothetical protein